MMRPRVARLRGDGRGASGGGDIAGLRALTMRHSRLDSGITKMERASALRRSMRIRPARRTRVASRSSVRSAFGGLEVIGQSAAQKKYAARQMGQSAGGDCALSRLLRAGA